MLGAIICSSALSSTRSRPFSAYSNLCSVDEDTDIAESQLIDWQSDVEECSCELEVEIRREFSQPGGLAFRIIGSRTSGIFVSYVDSKSQQASQLQEGDLIKECNGKNLSGITCDQAASILRFSLSREDILRLKIQRRGSGPSLMSKRRSLVHLSQEQEEHYRVSNTREYGNGCSFRLRQSVSCPDYRPCSNLPVRASVTNSKLLRKVDSIEEEIQLLIENQEQPSLENSTPPVPYERKNQGRCAVCSRKTKVKRLHMLSHRWMAASLKLLPIRRSNSTLHSTQYSLI